MKKSILYPTAILLAVLVTGACGNDDDDINNNNNNNNQETPSAYTVKSVAEAPSWQVNWTGNDSRPEWQEPQPGNYENWTTLLLQVEDELKPYATEDDMLALFVGDEVRGLTGPARIVADGEEIVQNGEFILKAFGNETDQNQVNVTLRYYSSQLQQVFTRSVEMKYEMGKIYGLDSHIVPHFTLGSPKYPVVTTMTLAPFTQALYDIQPVAGDMAAAFVGDECRGIVTLDERLLSSEVRMTVFGRQAGEAYTLKYYSNATQSIYTITKTVRQ